MICAFFLFLSGLHL